MMRISTFSTDISSTPGRFSLRTVSLSSGKVSLFSKKVSLSSRKVSLCGLLGLAILMTFGCGGGGGSGGGGEGEGGGGGGGTRPSNLTCVAPDRPLPVSGGGGGGGGGGISDVTVQRAFANESFARSLALIQHPTIDARWYVVRQTGQVDTFLDTNPAATRSRAVTVNVESTGEMGLLGMAFHPDFGSNGQVFLSYVRPGPGVGVSAIGRYRSDDNGLTFVEDNVAGEHEILTLNQPASNHNGGGLAFGPRDGYLYASFGDGGTGRDATTNGQDPNTLFATILRINVTNNSYTSPGDNPFVGSSAGADEVWAYGLRNPWRFSFDQDTGDLWIGDVGQRSFEEIDRIADRDNSGPNFGWPIKEGNSCYNGSACGSRTDLVDPVYDYGRDAGGSITGGFVYRGTSLSGFDGAYIYGDFISGRIWALFDATTNSPTRREIGTVGQVVGFGQGRDGEMYAVSRGGSIFRLVGDGTAPPPVDPFPAKLSETGCFESFDPEQPMSGLIPYEVSSPFWSDGAVKKRYMAVPNGTSISVASDGHFDFPIGTVLAKEFTIGSRIVETRLFMRHDDGDWGGYSYEWNASGTDATLLENSKRATINGVDWFFPGRADCFRCHTEIAGRSLGPEVAQLNFPIRHPDGTTENQVDRLVGNGVISGSLPNLPAGKDLMPGLDDASADAESKARAYLHANCAYCHQPGGTSPGPMDFRFATATANAGLCDEPPTRGDLGVSGSRIVFPGEPNLSVLLLRMEDEGPDRMPDFASELIDTDAVAVMHDWIGELTVCP